MVRPGRERLSGVVELDETYWGGPQEGLSGGQTERKALIAVAVEEKGVGMGRIRMRRVGDASAASLVPFRGGFGGAGSSVHTDDWLGYEPLAKKGYRHRIVFLSGRRKQRRSCCRGCTKRSRCSKRWMLGTHQGRSATSTWTTTSTSWSSVSTAATHAAAASCSIGWFNRRSRRAPPVPLDHR